jgi:hypothetical protein
VPCHVVSVNTSEEMPFTLHNVTAERVAYQGQSVHCEKEGKQFKDECRLAYGLLPVGLSLQMCPVCS